MRAFKITVGGRTFQIRSDADEEYLLGLAREIDNRFQSIKRSGMRQDQEFKAMAMVAIGLLDEMTSTKKSYESIREKAKQFASQMIGRIDALLSGGSL